MQWKLVSAFATGAVLASGIVYFAVRPADAPFVETRSPEAKPNPKLKPSPKAKPSRIAKATLPPEPKPLELTAPIERPAPAPITRTAIPFHPAVVVAPPPAPPRTEAVPLQNVATAPRIADARVPHVVTLTAGTVLAVRIGESLSAARNRQGDSFLATLTQPLVIDGWIIAERGARVEGRIVDMAQPGRANSGSRVGISIVRLATADGQNIRINTDHYVKEASAATGTDAAKIGGGAAIGAILGAIIGGGKGAAIGAGAGGAAGAGDVLLTRGKPAEIPVETKVSFRVQDSVTITERID